MGRPARVVTMTAETGFDRVISALEKQGLRVELRGDDAMAQCPAHEDRTPSLSISRGDGKALVNCHAGCDTAEVLAAIGLTFSDTFDEKRERQDRPQIVAVYDYTDETGALLFQKVRKEPGPDGAKKTFVIRRPDGHGGWIWNIGDAPRVLYRLPEVRAAIAAGKSVWITEGEKDADRLASLGVAATCNYDGAAEGRQRQKWTKWRREYAEQLRGAAKVIVVADNDPPGYAHARTVAADLAPIGAAVQVVKVAVD